jgi:hypothetical protein
MLTSKKVINAINEHAFAEPPLLKLRRAVGCGAASSLNLRNPR